MKRSVLNKLLLGSLVINMSVSPILAGCGSKNTESTSENSEVVETIESKESQNEIDDDELPIDIFEEESSVELEIETDEIEDTKTDSEVKNILKEETEETKKRKENIKNNSYSMMCYLAIVSENIRTSKDNRLALDDIYNELLNDINPEAIDKETQQHLKELRETIKDLRSVSVKRDRLNYIYEQNKALAMRSSVPDTLKDSLKESSLDLKELAINVLCDIVDSCMNPSDTIADYDREFLLAGWDLDDTELAAIQKNRDETFDYMVDMVRKYELDGLKTLSDEDIKIFVEISKIELPTEKGKRLEDEKDKYGTLGDYWCELADCYFKDEKYEEVLNCVKMYESLSTNIFRQDRKSVELYIKAVIAAQNVYASNKDKYVSSLNEYIDKILDNTRKSDWAPRYFVAQVYNSLYEKTNDKKYLENAFEITYNTVNVLLDGQRDIDSKYLKDVELLSIDSDLEKADKKKIKEYNKKMEKYRETECVALYEPLILNCDLLFELADTLNISQAKKDEIDKILQQRDIFLVDPVKNFYAFKKQNQEYNVELSKGEIVIPASMLTNRAIIEISVLNNGEETKIEDYEIDEVKREGTDIDQFYAHINSKTWKKYSWDEDVHVTIKIVYPEIGSEVTMKYKVSEYNKKLIGSDTLVFTKE